MKVSRATRSNETRAFGHPLICCVGLLSSFAFVSSSALAQPVPGSPDADGSMPAATEPSDLPATAPPTTAPPATAPPATAPPTTAPPTTAPPTTVPPAEPAAPPATVPPAEPAAPPATVPPAEPAAPPAPAAAAASQGSYSNVPATPFVSPFEPGRAYAPDTVMGIYQRGLLDGATPGFMTRFAYRLSYTHGNFDGTSVDVRFISPLEGMYGMGYRFRLQRQLSLTLEGELGAQLLNIISIKGFDAQQAARLGLPPDPEQIASGANDSAIGLMAGYLGPAASIEYSLQPGLGIYLRPSFDFVLGIPILQRGTTSGPITEPDGFLNGKLYKAQMFSVQAGFIFYRLTGRQLDLGVGYRSTSYTFEDLPKLRGKGFFLTLGATG